MTESTVQTKNRMVLLLIAGIPVTMILAATWLWFFVARGDLDLVGMLGTSNQGTLLAPPRELELAAMVDSAGREFHYVDLEPRWMFLVPYSGNVCDSQCERTLYLTRQIHTALGKEFGRIGRLYVSDMPVTETSLSVTQLSDERSVPGSFVQYLQGEQRGLHALQVSSADYAKLFAEQSMAADTWYLVDPGGWVMMSYDDSISYKDVISDLKFLLKNSSE